MTPDQVSHLAIHWANRGIPALPIAIGWDDEKGSTDKRPLTVHGHIDATTDLDVLARLIRQAAPKLRDGEVLAVGLHPGPAGRVVLDVDTKGGAHGDDELAALEAEHGPLPDHPIVDTASGGTHRWLAKPDGVHVGGADLAPGIEVRSDAGWVVAPGVTTPWGNWEFDEVTADLTPPAWPDWVADRLTVSSNSPSTGPTSRWQQLDRAQLHPADLAALEALETQGGHTTYLSDGAVMLTRPGKQSGASASIGYIAPGVVKMFTSNWPGFDTGGVYSLDGDGNLTDGPQATTLDTGDVPEAPQREPSQLIRLDDFLDQPDPDVTFRIARLLPAGGRFLLAAQYKAGKSTMVGNLIRALVDKDQFLGKYSVEPPDGPVVLIDDELDQNTLRRWLRDQGIVNTGQVYVLSLRGRLDEFNIMDKPTRIDWARKIADIGGAFVILDCLRPLIDALGLDENHDTGKVLVAFDELIGAAGAPEGGIVHHMGHGGERSRGDSRLRDWPDVEWKIVRKSADDESSERYFSAYGRDVDEPEQRLGLDEDRRRLTIVGGSRAMAEAERGLDAVMEELRKSDDEWMPSSAIVEAVGGHSGTARSGLKLAIERGRVEMVRGAELRRRGIERGDDTTWSPSGKYHRVIRLTVDGLGSWATSTGECVGCGTEGPLGTDDQCTNCRMGGHK